MTDRLEEALRRLPLHRPSAALDRRVLPHRRRPLVVGIAIGAAVAATLAIVGVLWALRVASPETRKAGPLASSPPSPAPAAEPRRTERRWTQVTYQGLIERADGPPLQAYRIRTLRNVQWLDPASGATVRKTVPEDRVMLVAAQLQ